MENNRAVDRGDIKKTPARRMDRKRREDVRETDFPLLGPVFLSLLTLVAGPMISGPAAGAVLVRLGFKRSGWLTAVFTSLAGVVFNAGLVLWPVKWYWSSLTLSGVHIVCAVILFFVMRSFYMRMPDMYRTDYSDRRRRDGKYMLAGMFGGAMMCTIFGGAVTVFFLLGSDMLFANIMPVTSSDAQSLTYFFVALFCLSVSGFIAGGYIGGQALDITPGKMLFYTLAIIWISLTWLLALQVIIAIPGFQAGQAAGAKRAAAWFPFITGNLFIGTWWAPFLFSYFTRPLKLRTKLFRLVHIPVVHLSAAVVLAILIGYPNNFFHAAGRYFERHAHMPAAMWCYEQGLKKSLSSESASYLQYRVALLAHKLGDRDRALQGFRKVVSKYTADEQLVKQANRFLDNLARNGGSGQRIVLPGVETQTAYKGSYCVPNSLALVMRFWGSGVDARDIGRRITGLGRGTIIVDQAWYAEQEGFRHDFLPNASVEDVKASIDAGFPVMVYVPAHVFVIVGYDETLETFITYDVATSDVWVEYIQKDFVKSWKKQGTTMVLAYPPTREGQIPDRIRNRLVNLSDEYLHYHLHYSNAPQSYTGSTHLLQAAGKKEVFFIPLTILYKDFPGLRPVLNDRYNEDIVAGSIVNFFSSDYNEGIHLWGQYHDEDDSREDRVLDYSLAYLIGQNQLKMARKLITNIEEQGPISTKTENTLAMIDLALGDFASGVHHIDESDAHDLEFYLALAELQLGNRQAAISGMAQTVDGCT